LHLPSFPTRRSSALPASSSSPVRAPSRPPQGPTRPPSWPRCVRTGPVRCSNCSNSSPAAASTCPASSPAPPATGWASTSSPSTCSATSANPGWPKRCRASTERHSNCPSSAGNRAPPVSSCRSIRRPRTSRSRPPPTGWSTRSTAEHPPPSPWVGPSTAEPPHAAPRADSAQNLRYWPVLAGNCAYVRSARGRRAYAHDEPAHAPATAAEEPVMSSNGRAPQGSEPSSADRDRPRPDTIIVGAGLAGLVAAHELTRAGRRVLVIDQENRANLGGQAFWSLGGLFLIDSPEQRRLGVRDSLELASADWA